jgi:hypothetical protein
VVIEISLLILTGQRESACFYCCQFVFYMYMYIYIVYASNNMQQLQKLQQTIGKTEMKQAWNKMKASS